MRNLNSVNQVPDSARTVLGYFRDESGKVITRLVRHENEWYTPDPKEEPVPLGFNLVGWEDLDGTHEFFDQATL